MDVKDLKDTVKELLDNFRTSYGVLRETDNIRRAFDELTQKICVIMEVAKHRDALEYYKYAMLDEGKENSIDIITEFTPILKVE